MSLFHAVVWTDHQSFHVLKFGAKHELAGKVKTRTHPARRHGSAARTVGYEMANRPSGNQPAALARGQHP